MTIEIFIKEVKKLGIDITPDILKKLKKYYELLIKWNKIINLTRIINIEDVYLKHFYDSLTIVKAYDLNKIDSLCDVGTGAGFPGIILKIFFPNIKITLIDSLNKRINFLKEVVDELDLKDIELLHSRMEDYSRKNIEKFDIITSRAVAKISVLTEISIQSLKINGHLLLFKSNYKEELNESLYSFNKLNCKLNNVVEFKLPIENSDRAIIDILKISKTDSKYPRTIDKIKKSL